MFEFITWLRAIAAALITNSHFGSVHPYEQMASGGLLGNLLFFAVSGFCLVPIRQAFFAWYRKRLLRIYPAVWLATGICILCGLYHASTPSRWFSLFLYPTYYHFIASIVVLYIPFYFIAKWAMHAAQPIYRLQAALLVIIGLYVLVYFAWYDKSYYHIGTVEEPMIRFIYLIAMLLGAWLRFKQHTINKKRSKWVYASLLLTIPLYGYSKIACAKGSIEPSYQLVDQISILLLLISILWCSTMAEPLLQRAPSYIRLPVSFIAGLTLEIYLIQYLIITHANRGPYPLNMVLITAGILFGAYLIRRANTWLHNLTRTS